MVPLRCGPLLAAAVTVTTLEPDPDAAEAVSHEPLRLAVHVHAVDGVVTVMSTVPPAGAMRVLEGTTV